MTHTMKWTLVLAVVLAACGTGGQTVDKTPDAEVVSGADAMDGIGDIAVDLAEETVDGGQELLFPEVVGPEVETPECAQGEGCFLDPCDENADCLSGWCVEHLGDGVCTQLCQEECPPGWTCQQAGTGPDLAYICVSRVANLCRPCATGADCKSPGGAEDVCVDYGEEGSFCGGTCLTDGDCPWGFSCLEVESVAGVTSKQCVADAGVCPCSAKSAKLGLATPCEASNEFGSCSGLRVCTDAGLSDCDAAAPSEEECNGVDDDCDGLVDEAKQVGGDSLNLCDDANPCTKDTCLGEGGCTNEALTNVECIDGDSCTVGDHCEEGVCVGQLVDCDDDNPCTTDSCDAAGGCVHANSDEKCDDGDPCTVADRCEGGTCSGTVIPCDCQADADCEALEDGDLCNGTLFCDLESWPYECAVEADTVVSCPAPPAGPDATCLAAACDPATGGCSLVPANEGAACDDQDLCTLGDKCEAGSCVGGPEPNCNDGNPCTDDLCDAAQGCVHTFNAAPCNDGDVCTTGDACSQGECVGGPALACDDGDLCNGVESCDPASGCKPGTPLVCNDGNLCNGTESCHPADGCKPGVPLNCDDGNGCTIDTCNPAEGCAHGNSNEGCDDGNACTTGDQCAGGKCMPGAAVDCDDENICTNDSCTPLQGCVHLLNSTPCDDGNLCTTGDHCHLGECIAAGELSCNDGNLCTDDSCSPAAGCVFKANSAACDDGNSCTTGDVCALGWCSGLPVSCHDGNPCTDDSCSPVQGCLFVNNDAACEDGSACTAGDLCSEGTCVGGAPLDCDDDNPCTADSCDDETGCVHLQLEGDCDDGDACTVDDVCFAGVCVGGGDLVCADGNICTNDSCDPDLGCLFVANDVACDDGNACTGSSACSGGECVGSDPVECDGDAWCQQNGCVASCVAPSCDPEQGCQFDLVPDCCGNGIKDGGEQCDDGNHVDGDGCTAECQSEGPPGPYYVLSGTPDPAHVFDSIVVTFRYPNNLTNGIWHKTSNTILVGEFSQSGYWWHSAAAGGYPSSPNNGSGRYGRMVHMPGTRMVAYTISPSSDGMGPAPAADLRLASINPDTGALGGPLVASFSDGYNGTCNILSSSVTELMIYDGGNKVRRYKTTSGSGTLTANGIVTLGASLPSSATCNGGHCYAGSFAWDGKYFYFSSSQNSSANTSYMVFLEDGTHVGTYNAAGAASINGTYFDWNVGRYAIHDGFGYRQGGQIYSSQGGTSDSQCYGPVSTSHTLVP